MAINSPNIIIETKRCFLREKQANDALEMYRLNLDPHVIKYTGDQVFNSESEARLFIENYKDFEKYKMGRWVVIDKSSLQYLGWCGLKYCPDLKEVDLGYRFHQKYWGKGFATECSVACLIYGFEELGLKRIVARAMKDNIGSIRVMDKIGMTYIGQTQLDNEDAVLYEVLKGSWKRPTP